MASAYFRYVSTEATTARASIARSSIPTRETRTQASMTTPLSRIRSTTSTRLDDPIAFSTAMMYHLPSLVKCPGPPPSRPRYGIREPGVSDPPDPANCLVCCRGSPSPKTTLSSQCPLPMPQGFPDSPEEFHLPGGAGDHRTVLLHEDFPQ